MNKNKIILVVSVIVIATSAVFIANRVLGVAIGGNLDMGSNLIINLADPRPEPTGNQDAATRSFVASQIAGITMPTTYWDLSGNNLYPEQTTYNVGIGAVPEAGIKLDVNGGSLRVNQGGMAVYGGSLRVNTAVLGAGGNAWVEITGDGIVQAGTTAGPGLESLRLRASRVLLVDNAGFAAVGDSSPDAKFDILNTGLGASFRVDDDVDNDTTPFIIDASGNVGIGTTDPTAYLTIEKNPSTQEIYRWAASSGSPRFVVGSDTYAPYLSLYDYANNEDVRIRTDGVTYFNGGDVGIGTASPGQKLDVDGAMRLRPRSSPPTATEGTMYYDSNDHKMKYYNGTTWIAFGGEWDYGALAQGPWGNEDGTSYDWTPTEDVLVYAWEMYTLYTYDFGGTVSYDVDGQYIGDASVKIEEHFGYQYADGAPLAVVEAGHTLRWSAGPIRLPRNPAIRARPLYITR